MATQEPPAGDEPPVRRKRYFVRRFFLIVLLVLAVVLTIAWLRRDQIAQQLITDTLDSYGVEATYEIESIEPGAQVLTDIVIGDPLRPDLTIERAEIRISPRLGMPGVSHLILENPRLFGSIVDGQPSFGALDPLLFTDSEEAFVFPDLELTLVDGRALVEGDYGPLAMRLDGAGHLRGGFAGELAVAAPLLQLPGCEARAASLFGEVGIDAERPQFAGPLRFEQLSCADADLEMADAGIELELRADRNLTDFEGQASIQAGAMRFAANRLGALQGDGRFTFRGGDLTSDFALEGRDLETGAVRLALIDAEGSLRGQDDFSRLELDADVSGRNLLLGSDVDATLAGAVQAGEGSLLAPLMQKLRQQLARETRGSIFNANLTARREDDRLSLSVPEARLRGRSGASLLTLTHGQFAIADGALPLFSGNFLTGGEGLPRISGRMEQNASGGLEMHMQMREYAAGDARLELPELRLQQARSSAFSFSGSVKASGALPGGFARGLSLPVSGTLSPAGAVSMWSSCTDIGFERLQISSLQFARQALTLCPPSGSSILRYNSGGLAVAAGLASLELDGLLGETPLHISSGPVGFAYPGAMSAQAMDIVLGAEESAARFALADLSAQLGEQVSGTFSGVDVQLAAVPLDILQAGGNWSFEDGQLALSGARFIVEDREEVDRFKPLMARGATLTLADNVIESHFMLEHPASGAQVVRVAMEHDLGNATGNADLMVDALTFRDGFQPDDLTESLKGVAANVEGTVFGRGRIDWNEVKITSSGRFTSESLDLAAAFGPVRGARGTIEFSDLLGLTTLPNQWLYVDAINPGIEVYDGELALTLTDGSLLQLEEARWPFMGGQLTMRPITLAVGVEEVRRYVLEIEGVQAQRFIEHMQLGNIGATGTFDGTIPVVFDEQGNGRLEGGVLTSRAPGGSVSYIGDLTYEDLSPIANYAFDALRALEYDEMHIGMDGSLTGELVTSVRFDGVRQGEGTQSNFVTRRLANLPIRFIVNVRAPFYSMMTDLRSLYDPTAVRDPRGLGLMDDDGTRFVPGSRQSPATSPDEPDIQPPESEAMQ